MEKVCQILKKVNMLLSYDPAIAVQRKENLCWHTNLHTVICSSFIHNSYKLVVLRMVKQTVIPNTMEHSSVLKRKQTIYTTTWTNLQRIMLSEEKSHKGIHLYNILKMMKL